MKFISNGIQLALWLWFSSSFFKIYLFIYLWLCWVFVSVRGLSSSCGKRGPLLIAVRGPLTITASLVAEHRLQTRRLSNCGSRAQLLRGTRDPPRPGPELASPAPAGRFPTTAPPGKPLVLIIFKVEVHGTLLVAQWLRICLPVRIQALSGKIPCTVEQLSPCATTTKPVCHNY